MRLFVAGGAGSRDQELATSESYDLRRGQWRPERPMPTARRGLAAVAARGRVWVVGGGRELESFDPDAREWQRHAPMQAARFSPGTALFRDRLWVLGGNGKKLEPAIKKPD